MTDGVKIGTNERRDDMKVSLVETRNLKIKQQVVR